MKTTCVFLLLTVTIVISSALPTAQADPLSAMPPYTWRFTLPADAPYEDCTITFYAGGRALETVKTVKKGGTISATYARPLSMIFGYCNGAYFLNGQYCDGVDVKQGDDQTKHSCARDVSVIFCAKTAIPKPFNSGQYGFCPK